MVSELLRIPHSLDSRLTDGGKVISLTHWTLPTPQNYSIPASGTHYSETVRNPQNVMQMEGLGKLMVFNCFTGSRNRELLVL
jgi:hypothetical protein